MSTIPPGEISVEMHQRSFLFKLTLWAVLMAVLIGAGTLLLRHEFWGILGLWFVVFGVIPWVPGMLFTVPFAIHSHRRLTERPDGRIAISQGELWQSLQGWVIAWLLLGCLAFAGGMYAAPVKSDDSWSYARFVRGDGRTSQVPGDPHVPFAMFHPTPAGRRHQTISVPRRGRRYETTKGLSELNSMAFGLAAWASPDGLPTYDARFASSCWSGATGRGSHPQGPYERFPSCFPTPLLPSLHGAISSTRAVTKNRFAASVHPTDEVS